MNRSLTIQLSLLGLSLIGLLVGIALQKPVLEKQHPLLTDLVSDIEISEEVNEDGQKLMVEPIDEPEAIRPNNDDGINNTETNF